MYRVETHNNSKKYFSSLNIEKDALYVTANTSLSNMIKELSKCGEEDRWRVLDIENFIKTIYPNWTDSLNKIKLKAEMRNAILDVKSKLTDAESIREINFLEENISLVVSDFMFFVEAGVKKLNYKTNDKKLELIKEIFNKYVESEIFKQISREVLNIESTTKFKNNIIINYLKRLNKKDPIIAQEIKKKLSIGKNEVKRIYFYNVNFLDLKRYMIIELLKNAGYEIIFRVPYFENLNVINKSWDILYKNNELFSVNIDRDYSRTEKEKLKYISFLEGINFSSYDEEHVNIKTYREVYDFKKDIKGKSFITFYKDSLQSCMERDKINIQNHCYQNAIGRFLFNLYKCKVSENEVKMDFNTYREMITSGWFEYKEWNGVRLASYLIDNADYFSGVKTLDDIITRIEKVKDIEEIGGIFEDQVKGRIKKDKRKAFLSNPFKALGYVNTEKYNVTANYMLEVTLRLKKFLIKNFNETNGLININEHFEYLRILFRNKYLVGVYKDGSENEKKICKRIFGLLNNPQLFGEHIHKDELSELLSLYLVLEDKEKEENEEENDFSIDQLEGFILRERFNRKNQNKIYLTDLSYKAYEKYMDKNRFTEKVITKEDINYIFNESLTGKNKEIVITGLELQEKSKQAIESYIKFTLANLFINYDGVIELSWIEGLRTDDSKSILLKQIEAIYINSKNIAKGLEPYERMSEEEIEAEVFTYEKKKIKDEGRSLPEVAYRDLDFCGDKFLYSSILEEYPMYYSDFHHKLVFAALVGMFKNSIEEGYKNLYNHVLPLFPQWKDVAKKNILDCEYAKKELRDYRYFDGINYPKNMDAIYLLKSKYVSGQNSKIRNKYKKGEFNGERYFNEFIDEYLKDESLNSGLHCKMCPHCYICKKGEFVIDCK